MINFKDQMYDIDNISLEASVTSSACALCGCTFVLSKLYVLQHSVLAVIAEADIAGFETKKNYNNNLVTEDLAMNNTYHLTCIQ